MKKIIALFAVISLISSPAYAGFAATYGSYDTPTVSNCGTSPSLNATASDKRGTITVGSGILITSCKLNFSASLSPYDVECIVSLMGLTGVFVSDVAVTGADMTVTFLSAAAGAKITYRCDIQ